MKTKKERYLIISDLHVPDHDIKTLKLIYKFINFYKPDYLDILGDIVNFTKISKYTQDPYYEETLQDEVATAREVIQEIVETSKKANPNTIVTLFEGNHEARLQKFLARNAQELAKLAFDDEEYLISVPHLLQLKKYGIKWVPETKVLQRHNVSFFHGQTVRMKAGFSAQANIDKFGTSGFTGHTHRLAHITRTQSGNTKFWIETGTCANLFPSPAYVTHPDWTQGFATAEYSFETHQFYPQIVPIINHSFSYNGEMFI